MQRPPPVSAGRMHLTTRYVMNHLLAACSARQILEHVSKESIDSTWENLDYRKGGTATFHLHPHQHSKLRGLWSSWRVIWRQI